MENNFTKDEITEFNRTTSFLQRESFYFLVDSDLHFQRQQDGIIECRKRKRKRLAKIQEIKKRYKIEALICAGDLTNSGTDDMKLFGIPLYDADELGAVKTKYINPIEMIGIPVYENVGEKDVKGVKFGRFRLPVKRYVESRHGSILYTFRIRNLRFISLGLYPDDDAIAFLAKQDLTRPTVLIFHYNLFGKQIDNIWKWEDREEFYKIIKYRNIKAIIVGHRHKTKVEDWNGYDVYIAGGSKMILLKWNGIDVEFVEKI